jgi:hypothetical protein
MRLYCGLEYKDRVGYSLPGLLGGIVMALPRLDMVLGYQNPAVLNLYRQNYPHNKLSAEEAWQEMLKYLWLSQKHAADRQENVANLPSRCIMLQSMLEIDQMWHEFILFTKDYQDFCWQYFGAFIHHLPNLFDTMPISPEQAETDLVRLLPYIYDQLGEQTLRTWCAAYIPAEAS